MIISNFLVRMLSCPSLFSFHKGYNSCDPFLVKMLSILFFPSLFSFHKGHNFCDPFLVKMLSILFFPSLFFHKGHNSCDHFADAIKHLVEVGLTHEGRRCNNLVLRVSVSLLSSELRSLLYILLFILSWLQIRCVFYF